jgi:hypothetical protein
MDRESDMMKHFRKIRKKERPKIMLIYCEGEKTEPNYFKSFKQYLHSAEVNIIIDGEGYNTRSLVERVIALKEDAEYNREEYDIIWAVFDKDSFTDNDFNAAITLADNNGINVAYSIEAFELWYLLHFNYDDAAHSRTQYKKILTNSLGVKYKKNDPDTFDKILDKQVVAIRNARRLTDKFDSSVSSVPAARKNPSTTVYKLVEALNEYKK